MSRTLPALARQTTRSLGFVALTVGTGALVYRAVERAPDAQKPAARDEWSGAWARSLLALFDVEVRTNGRVAKDATRGRVVVANHRSIIDIALLLAQFGGCVVARGDIEKWPVIGPAIAAGGTIFVDRSDKKSGSNAVAQMIKHLSLHESISLFPEGTTFEDDPVRPFRVGGFVAAERANAVVLPVGIAYPEGSGAAYGGETFVAHLSRLAASRGTVAHVEIGEPMDKRPDETPANFAERARAEVERLVGVARAKSRALSADA
jgi:1-acyl-sn-glycerol-3-phosphate acyltransferase